MYIFNLSFLLYSLTYTADMKVGENQSEEEHFIGVFNQTWVP